MIKLIAKFCLFFYNSNVKEILDIKQVKYELQNLLSGKSSNSYNAPIQTISQLLRSDEKSGPMAEEKHQNKEQETKQIIDFAREN